MLDVFKVSFGFSTYGGAKSRKYKRQLPVATCGVKILKRYNRCLPVAIYSAEKLKKYKDLYFLAEKTRYIATTYSLERKAFIFLRNQVIIRAGNKRKQSNK